MKRGELKVIYNKISDTEKRQWAKEAGYTAFTGLYKYLNNKQNAEAYDTVTQALVVTIGQEKLNRLRSETTNKNTIIQDGLEQSRNILIKSIYSTNNEEKLEQIKKDIIQACENQINWIRIGEA